MPKASNGYDGNGCLNLSGTCFSFKTMKLNLLGANKSSLHRMMLRDKHVNFLTPTISLTNPLWPLFPNFVPTIIEAHLPPKLANIRLKYRTRTIITRGLYTFYPLYEVQKTFFQGALFLKILALCMISIQERVMVALGRRVHRNCTLKLETVAQNLLLG